jgi:hypothetical protein
MVPVIHYSTICFEFPDRSLCWVSRSSVGCILIPASFGFSWAPLVLQLRPENDPPDPTQYVFQLSTHEEGRAETVSFERA